MGDGSETIKDGETLPESGATLPGTGDTDPASATVPDTLAADTLAADDLHDTIPKTITPDPALTATVTDGTEQGEAARHSDTLPLGSAPTRAIAEGRPAVKAGAEARRRDMVGTTVAERYRVKSLLGSGGMGTVYLADQVAMDRQVVLKFLHTAYSSRADLKERFHREARAASKIKNSNTIVLHDFGQTDDGTLYMAMEYLEGRTLTALIESAGAVAPLRAVGITLQALASLTDAHARGVVHRDLKPDNILLVEQDGVADFVKVLDFGIAQIREPKSGVTARHRVVQVDSDDEAPGKDTLESWEALARRLDGDGEEAGDIAPQPRLTKHGEICGSPGYMAPEQVRGAGGIDQRADLFAVGVILYELLTGTNPFSGKSIQQMLLRTMDLQVEPLRRSHPHLELPRQLDELILACLSKDAAGRPSSAEEVVGLLRDLTPALARRQQAREQAMLELVGIRPRWRRHLRWALPLLAVAAAALIWLAGRGALPGEGAALAPGQRVLVAVSRPKVPAWVANPAAAGRRVTARGERRRRTARVLATARILAVAADVPSRYVGHVEPAAARAELMQVASHSRGAKDLPAVQTYWVKIAVGREEGGVAYVYDVHAHLPQLSADVRLRLRRHFAALRYDRYSFLLTEAVRKRQCKRVEEFSTREREAIDHLPKDRQKSALNYLQYRLRKCGIQQPQP